MSDPDIKIRQVTILISQEELNSISSCGDSVGAAVSSRKNSPYHLDVKHLELVVSRIQKQLDKYKRG